MTDPAKPIFTPEQEEAIRQHLREFDDKRRVAMIKWWEDWKVSTMTSPSSHVITAALAAVSTKWLIPLVMKWLP